MPDTYLHHTLKKTAWKGYSFDFYEEIIEKLAPVYLLVNNLRSSESICYK